MSKFSNGLTLPWLLRLDSVTCVAMGALLALASDFISNLTEIPAKVLIYAGLSLIPIAIFMALVSWRRLQQKLLAQVVIAGNIVWVLGSLALLGMVEPNGFGIVFVLAQAGAVAVFALLEWRALEARARHAGTTA
ncbi:hypothetical protein [Nitratireductor sp. ZSWI3]|uniref:hypothetical protein n=1 Tax=Nitratireductor sp. ZSWI3 TaxID=2966359 RepID=UPI00214F83DA|nr:hypothetical protein [Nitratireductor sp. ZSWI3]MCR4265906.1 hypothetical protein [Nitratireductor sp. ZSWI3]